MNTGKVELKTLNPGDWFQITNFMDENPDLNLYMLTDHSENKNNFLFAVSEKGNLRKFNSDTMVYHSKYIQIVNRGSCIDDVFDLYKDDEEEK